MTRRLTILFLLACLAGTARPAAPSPPARTDLSGDRLPAGAIARLGSEGLHQTNVACLLFSPDGRTLASLGLDGNLHLAEVRTGKQLHTFSTPPFPTFSPEWVPVAFSPDGSLLAMGCADQVLRLWDTTSGRECHRLTLTDRATCVAFSPDGRRLACSGHRLPVHLCDPARGKVLARWDGEGADALAWSADGQTLTTLQQPGRGSRVLCLRDAPSGKVRAQHEVRIESQYACRLSPDGGFLASPTWEGDVIRLWRTATARELPSTTGKTSWSISLSFSADGRLMTATSGDGIARVWETTAGKLLHQFRATPGRMERVALSPDGRLLALIGEKNDNILLWDVAHGQPTATDRGHEAGPLTVAFTSDGRSAVTVNHHPADEPAAATHRWSVRRWSLPDGTAGATAWGEAGEELRWTVFSADGRLLAVVTAEGSLRLWDVAAGKESRRWKVPTHAVAARRGPGSTSIEPDLLSLAFAADGRTLFATDFTGQVRRWDTATGKELPALKAADGSRLESCLPSPDDQVVLVTTRGENRRLVLLDADVGDEVWQPPRGISPGEACFAPDGRTLAVDTGGEVRLCEPFGGERAHLEGSLPGSIKTLAFSPDGRLVAAASRGGLWVWAVPTGRLLLTLTHGKTVESLVFSPDGRWLASAGEGHTALVWDVAGALAEALPREPVLTRTQQEALWADLGKDDSRRAHQAVWRLAAAGADAVRFLRPRLQPVAGADTARITRLVTDLDDDAFNVREAASRELARLGKAAEPALRKALAGSPSAEVRRRADQLLADLKSFTVQELRLLRAVEVLEHVGTPEARQVLEALASGTEQARLTRTAKAALERVNRRRTATP
jgi:WD40 repeat protein